MNINNKNKLYKGNFGVTWYCRFRKILGNDKSLEKGSFHKYIFYRLFRMFTSNQIK